MEPFTQSTPVKVQGTVNNTRVQPPIESVTKKRLKTSDTQS